MMRKNIFTLSHELLHPSFNDLYKKLINDQWKSQRDIDLEQQLQLRNMLIYCYNQVPYYREIFRSLGLHPQDIRTKDDLEKLPILTKDTIKENWESLKPIKLERIRHSKPTTGGSTGTPLNYRLSSNDRFLGAAIMYRGWGYGGYELGDRMVLFGGSSLGISVKPTVSKALHEITRNIKKLSSFDLDDEKLFRYTGLLNRYKPKFIRGYASSINFYAKWLEDNNTDLDIELEAVFTTAEKLYPHMRKTIMDVFDCDVFDGYGLNDGGVSAYECSEHLGLHIDTERSIMEVVNNDGETIDRGDGQIIATSLHNYAMPFIRYSTGDDASLFGEPCSCGRGQTLLKEVMGRTVDFLITPEGENIHGWFFLYIFWEYCRGIKEYQVIQNSLNEITVKLVIDDEFDDVQLNKITDIVYKKSKSWNLNFVFVNKIERTDAGKYKFIINNI